MKYAATGFMYTHRSVYEKIAEYFKMPLVKIWGGQYMVKPYFFPTIFNDEYLGEDFSFCHKAREAGIKIYSQTQIRLSHIGKYSYSFAFIEKGKAAEPQSVFYKQSTVYRQS